MTACTANNANRQKVRKAHKTRKNQRNLKITQKKARAIRHWYLPDLLNNALIQRSHDINQFGNWVILGKDKNVLL